MISISFLNNYLTEMNNFFSFYIQGLFQSTSLHIFTQLYLFNMLNNASRSNTKIDKMNSEDIKDLDNLINNFDFNLSEYKKCEKIKKIIALLEKYGMKQRFFSNNGKFDEYVQTTNTGEFTCSKLVKRFSFNRYGSDIVFVNKACNFSFLYRSSNLDQQNTLNIFPFEYKNSAAYSMGLTYNNCRLKCSSNNKKNIGSKKDTININYNFDISLSNINKIIEKLFYNLPILKGEWFFHRKLGTYIALNMCYNFYKKFCFVFLIERGIKIIQNGKHYNSSLSKFYDTMMQFNTELIQVLSNSEFIAQFKQEYVKLFLNNRTPTIKECTKFYNDCFYENYTEMIKRKQRAIQEFRDKLTNSFATFRDKLCGITVDDQVSVSADSGEPS